MCENLIKLSFLKKNRLMQRVGKHMEKYRIIRGLCNISYINIKEIPLF